MPQILSFHWLLSCPQHGIWSGVLVYMVVMTVLDDSSDSDDDIDSDDNDSDHSIMLR